MNARGRFDRTRYVVHPRRDMLSGGASVPRAQAYGFGMGHVLRLNSLRSLWMSFLAYNLARSGIALSRGNAEGARLCLAQTKGLWRGFLAGGSVPGAVLLEFESTRAKHLSSADRYHSFEPLHPQEALRDEYASQVIRAELFRAEDQLSNCRDRSLPSEWN